MEERDVKEIARAKQAKAEGKIRAVILPGNGVDDIDHSLWYPWVKKTVESSLNIPVFTCNFPDPLYAHENIWTSFVKNDLQCDDEKVILIGHSSGAACALRLMEGCKFLGCVLVSAYHSDMGDALERESGYFNRPFNWKLMRENVQWLVQFHSQDDHLVPVSQARFVHQQLNSEYHELEDEGHFQSRKFPQLIEVLKEKLTSQHQQ